MQPGRDGPGEWPARRKKDDPRNAADVDRPGKRERRSVSNERARRTCAGVGTATPCRVEEGEEEGRGRTRRRSCNYICMRRSYARYKWPCIMNEAPDEPAGLSHRKNGPVISPKSYHLPPSFRATDDILEPGRG